MNVAHIKRPHDRLRELALFAGGGGGIIAGQMLGWQCVCAVEIDAAAAGVLLTRQNQSDIEAFPIWDNVVTFDGNPWRGIIDVVSGGFPCTDISCAGQRAGIDGEASGLWTEMARIIGEVRPCYAFIENAADLPIRGLDRVLCDLAAMGFDAQWGNFPASAVGAGHERMRTWLLATHPDRARQRETLQRSEHDRHDGQGRKEKHEPRHSHEPIADAVKRGIHRQGAWTLPVGQTTTITDVISNGTGQGNTLPKPEPENRQTASKNIDVGNQNPADTLRNRLERLIQQGRLSETEGDAIQAAARYTGTRNWLPIDSGLCGVVHGLADRLDDAA